MNIAPRCVGACKDNTQCGRRVVDGSQPPLCHLHRANPNLSPIIPPSDDVDEMKTLKRLANDRNPQIRLRAVDLLISLRKKDEKECEQCARRREESAIAADAWRRATDEQMQELGAMFKRLKELKALAATQPIQPGANYV
jgi:hypothetical protein